MRGGGEGVRGAGVRVRVMVEGMREVIGRVMVRGEGVRVRVAVVLLSAP